MAQRIQKRRDTAAAFTAANTLLAQGEEAFELDTGKQKRGDGFTQWNSLDYLEEGGGTGTVTSVNSVGPDGGGNIELEPADIGAETAGAASAALSSANAYTDGQISTEVTNRNAAISGAIATEVNDRNNAISAAQAGIKWKNSARAATIANITLSGTQTIDGVALTAGQRVLVKNQTTQTQNGIYVVAAGAWARSDDADIATELQSAVISIEEGTVNADTTWRQTTDNITIGSSNIVWGVFGSTAADATETVKGVAEIATTLEVSTGTDDARIVTPLKLAQQKNIAGGIAGLDGSGNFAQTTDNLPEGALSTRKYFSAAQVLATVLTGLSTASNIAIVAADNIIQAFGKLQAQITAAINSIPTKATQSDVDTGTDDTKYITSLTNRGNQEKFRLVTANFTVDSADRGGTILTTSATDITGTINQVTPGLSTLLPQAQIIARGAGNVNLVAGSGVSLIVAGVVSSSAFIEAGGGALLSWESVTVVRVTTGSAAQWAQIAFKPTTMLGYAITDGWRNLFQTFTTVGTPNSTTETDLLSQDMGSNKLAFDGERIVVEASGTFAATPSNAKRIRVLLGATLIADTTAVLLGSISWTARITVMRTASNAQRVWAVVTYGTAVATGYTELTGSDLSTALLLTIKGTGVATADVTLQMASGDKTGKA